MKRTLVSSLLIALLLLAQPATAQTCSNPDIVVEGKVERIHNNERGVDGKHVSDMLVGITKRVRGVPKSFKDIYVQIDKGSFPWVKRGGSYRFKLQKNRNRLEVLDCKDAVARVKTVVPKVVVSKEDKAKRLAAEKARKAREALEQKRKQEAQIRKEKAEKQKRDAQERAEKLRAAKEAKQKAAGAAQAAAQEKAKAKMLADKAKQAAAKRLLEKDISVKNNTTKEAIDNQAPTNIGNSGTSVFPPFQFGIFPPPVMDRDRSEGTIDAVEEIKDSQGSEAIEEKKAKLLERLQKEPSAPELKQAQEPKEDSGDMELPDFLDF